MASLRYTPYPALFHGVVHFGIVVVAHSTGEETSCDVGLIVHPVNSPPTVQVDKLRLATATGGNNVVAPYTDVHLEGVLRLADPDEEDFSDWFSQRTHAARLTLNASCGTLSFELLDVANDYVLGVESGSIAGAEGLTFHSGDGHRDAFINITSTLDNLNGQLHRLYYHSEGCREHHVTIVARVDDLGNWGAGGPLMDEDVIRISVSAS